MSDPDLPRRRHQFRIWMAMLVPVAFAAMFLPMAGIDPSRRDPNWQCLAREQEWAARRVDHYRDRNDVLHASRPRVLKISLPEGFQVDRPREPYFPGMLGGGWFADKDWVEDDGHCWSDVPKPTGNGGENHPLPPGGLAELRRLAAALPPSQWFIPIGRAYIVGMPVGDSWEVRTYDRDALPPEVARLGRFVSGGTSESSAPVDGSWHPAEIPAP